MKTLVAILLILFVCIVAVFFSVATSETDSCLDSGYCWDYVRNRCEKVDQGYCTKNKSDCEDRGGEWNNEKQYCKFNFN